MLQIEDSTYECCGAGNLCNLALRKETGHNVSYRNELFHSDPFYGHQVRLVIGPKLAREHSSLQSVA
jgi:hypothetical protein